MKLILCRHGAALDRGEALKKGMDDADRPLIEKGRERTKAMSRFLKKEIEDFQYLIYSPLLRSIESAKVIKEFLQFEKEFEVSEIMPESSPELFAKWMAARLPNARSALVVGHEPQLSSLASWLLAGKSEGFIELKKSGIIYLEVENFQSLGPSNALLHWVLSPKLL